MALINAPKKYVLTLIAISPQDKLNTEQRKTGEHFANDNCVYWLVDHTIVIADLAYALLDFFHKQKQSINVDLNSFIKLLPLHDSASVINAFFSADSFATDNYSLKTKSNSKPIKHNFIIDQKQYMKEIKVAQTLIDGEVFARTLMNMPGNLLHADQFEKECRRKFQGLQHVKFSVLHKSDLIRKKMGLILAVGQASPKYNEPRIIVVEYRNDHSKKSLALVGKGLMFDTGGLNLKPGESMATMHIDMAGAAITLSTIYVLAKLKVKANVVGLATVASNEIGPHAYRINDVITSYSGHSVEILNTDAEGRLALADGITYAKNDLKANTIMTVATLTGAISIALGELYTGIWATNDQQWEMLKQAASSAPELIWRMPFHKVFSDAIIGNTFIADIANMSPGRLGGSNTAAEFLHYFAGDINFIHADIAGSHELHKRSLAVMLKTLYYFAKDFK